MTGIISDNVGRAGGLVKAAGGGGSLVRLETKTVAASSYDFETGLSSTYDQFMLVWRLKPVTDGAYFEVQVGTGSVTYQTSGYEWLTAHWSNEVNNIKTHDESDSKMRPHSDRGVGNAGSEGCTGKMFFNSPSSTDIYTMFHWTGYVINDSTDGFVTPGGGHWEGATDAGTGIRLKFSSGNISGEASLYGVVRE